MTDVGLSISLGYRFMTPTDEGCQCMGCVLERAYRQACEDIMAQVDRELSAIAEPEPSLILAPDAVEPTPDVRIEMATA